MSWPPPDGTFAPPDHRSARPASRPADSPPGSDENSRPAADAAPARRRLASPGHTIRLLVFGLIALILAGVIGVWAIGVILAQTDQLPLQVTKASHARVGQLQVGHCLRAVPVDGFVTTVVAVPCDATHKAQVVAAWEVESDSVTRPDGASLEQSAKEKCASVQLADDPADAGYVIWLPTEAGWAEGDRRAVCLVQAPTLTRTLLPS